MINNLELIKPLLNFKSSDDFYFVQIIQRKKDNPGTSGTNNSARLITSYYIKSIENLEERFEEMKMIADLYNARLCINLNKRSFERTAFHTLKKITDQLLNKDFKSVRRAYNHACGEYCSDSDKKWIVDIDNNDLPSTWIIEDTINKLRPDGEKIIVKIPTKTGLHLITRPFELHKFKEIFPQIDVHKNNPTNLYIP